MQTRRNDRKRQERISAENNVALAFERVVLLLISFAMTRKKSLASYILVMRSKYVLWVIT